MILPNKQNFDLFKFWITLVFSGARVVLVTVSESKAFNLQKGIYTFPEKFVYEMSEMCRQSRADYVETWFQLANKVEHMNLTVQEANILKCIGLFSSGKKKVQGYFFRAYLCVILVTRRFVRLWAGNHGYGGQGGPCSSVLKVYLH